MCDSNQFLKINSLFYFQSCFASHLFNLANTCTSYFQLHQIISRIDFRDYLFHFTISILIFAFTACIRKEMQYRIKIQWELCSNPIQKCSPPWGCIVGGRCIKERTGWMTFLSKIITSRPFLIGQFFLIVDIKFPQCKINVLLMFLNEQRIFRRS